MKSATELFGFTTDAVDQISKPVQAVKEKIEKQENEDTGNRPDSTDVMHHDLKGNVTDVTRYPAGQEDKMQGRVISKSDN